MYLTVMLGWTLLNSAMYFFATGVSGVQPHQVISPVASAVPEPPVGASLLSASPPPPPQAPRPMSMPLPAINATARLNLLLIVVLLFHDCLVIIKASAELREPPASGARLGRTRAL